MTLLMLALGVSPAGATEVGVGGYIGVLGPVGKEAALDPFSMGGVRLRYRPSNTWGAEASFGIGTDGYSDPRLEVLHFLGDGTSKVQPFVAAGVGLSTHTNEAARFIGDVGLGIDSELFPVLDLRTDARFRYSAGENAFGGLLLTAGLQLHSPRVRDRDGDGILDSVDACLDEPEDMDGWVDTDGCPELDNDNDGVVDTADTCPDDAEDVDNHADADGCPDPDNDGDGVLDGADKCADVAEDKDGFEDADGCPDLDNDGDGVNDTSDKCPLEPETKNGYQDKDGCPDEVPEAVKKFSGKIEGINFETGKATIKTDSFRVLDSAYAVLQQFPEVRVEVQGHTDNVGDDAKNLKLSQDRAQAVVDYFVKKGLAADRLVAKGFGETKPVVENDTKANQALNRRVEFLLIQ